MSNYIPNYRKKKDILEKREFKLIKAIDSNLSPDKLTFLAQEVRKAQLRVINVKHSRISPIESDENDKLLKRIERDIDYWNSISEIEIINHYR